MDIRVEAVTHLQEYASISIAFEVDHMLDVVERGGGLGGLELVEKRVSPTYVKDYDTADGHHPTDWPKRFDVSNWGVLTARENGALIGGAIVAMKTEGLDILEQRNDLAVLWDLRVTPEARGRGTGTRLFSAAVQWANERGCPRLKVESQNVNVSACRFYARMGCTLGGINRFAYPGVPEAVQLLWYHESIND